MVTNVDYMWGWASKFTWQQLWDVTMAAGVSRVLSGWVEAAHSPSKKTLEFSGPKTAYLKFCQLGISVEISGGVMKLGHWCVSNCGL